MVRKTTHDPHTASKDKTGDRQVGGKAVLRHISAVGEAGRHHPPADETLKATKRQQADQRHANAFFHAAGYPEERQWKRKNDADTTCQKPVRPLPPENRLEFIKAHALVDFLILRNALVKIELFLPLLDRKRWNGAVDWLPLGNRQA
ncbi:hypothetical protein D3C80_1496160 [compost metagenome]